ncbi:MAG: insulinase family protein [Lachnospiraceae bacterium]|nr:insulinase family protein [Lachnospiraceae bacterium]
MKDLTQLNAYTLVKTEELPDLAATGYYLRHNKSGARVVWVENKDDNKVFSIAFRTPPADSTGVAHIIEHTVLCGSEHFPAKDPFIELAKGSLNTFLNAMTFPDKTMYPVASCNMQDFKNLMHVYLDAVFYPNIYKREEIFKQEGWHYELESEDADLIYNGIVYSEMKGAFSSPEQVLSRVGMHALYPDTAYGVESGGDPDVIPELSYQEYLDFHRRYYHPVNSYIYLYGDMDIEERLNWMDEEYLSRFEAIELDSEIKPQKEFGEIRTKTEYYSVEEEKENGVFYSYSVFLGDWADLTEAIAFEVLDQVLFSNPGAPVKQALIDAGLGEDFMSGMTNLLQPNFSIVAKNAKPGDRERFAKVLRRALEKCVTEGLKKTTVLAAINAQEFRYREADFGRFPKGLMHGINLMSTWLYDDNQPFVYMHANKVYAELKEKAETDYFEQLIRKYFLESRHGVLLELVPKAGYNAEKERALKAKLAAYKAKLSKAEVLQLVADTKALKAYQDEPSTKEQLETIPLLSISDIEKKAKGFKNEKFLEGKAEAVWHNIFTSDISYIDLMFNAKKVAKADVPYLGLLSDVLVLMDTKKHTYQELVDEVNMYTGGIETGIVTYSSIKNHKMFLPKFTISVKALTENTGKALEFVKEILFETVFSDRKRLNEILLELKSRHEMKFMGAGHSVAISRAASYYNESAAFEEAVRGVDYYEFIKNITMNLEEKYKEVEEGLVRVTKQLFTKENLLISLTCAEEGKKALEEEVPVILEALYPAAEGKELHMTCIRKNEGFKTPGQVQYVIRSGNFLDAGVPYHGSYEVLQTLLGFGYLWNEIRVKGGAYGGGISINSNNGNVFTYSYRDPNLAETNRIYEGLPAYVENFEADEREMTKNILGTMSSIDAPMTPRIEGIRSLAAYLTGKTEEEIQKTRDEILATTAEDIRKTKPMLEALLAADCICAVGSAAKVEECKDMFYTVKTLL